MKLENHINKISWALFDKVIFIAYGVSNLLQMRIMDLQDFGLLAILIAINTYLFILSDAISLNNIIQFRSFTESIKKVNSISLFMHVSIVMTLSLIIFLFKIPIASLFHDSRIAEVAVSLPLLSLLMIPRTYCGKFIMSELNWKKMFFVDLAFLGTMMFIILYFVINKWTMSYNQAVNIYYIGTGGSSVLAIILSRKDLVFGLKGEITFKQMMKFSIPFTITTTMHTLPKYLDVVIIQLMFRSVSVVAIYQAAKNLFRVFDEGLNAANGLIYPGTIKLIAKGDLQNLKDTLSKAISFMLFTYVLAFIVLNLGVIELVVKWFLTDKYLIAIPLFKVMMFAVFAMPFGILYFVITAFHKQKDLMKIVFIASFLSIVTFFLVGFLQIKELIPLGIVVYSVVLTTLTLTYSNKVLKLDFGFSDIFRAPRDTFYFIQRRLGKSRF